jgi:Zn-dependent M16 (insulinase) family peptidase
MLGMMSHWIYDKNPFDGVRFEAALKELKSDLSSGQPVFQELLKKYLVANEHRVTVEMKPDATLEQKAVAAEEARLAAIKETLTTDDIKKVNEWNGVIS